MLMRYIQAAMEKAKYEILPDDGSFYAEVPKLQGVWANAPTLEECRKQLQEVIEDWILIGLWHHHVLPVIDGIDLNPKSPDQEAA